MRRVALLDLILTKKEGLVGDVKDEGSFCCTDHDMVGFGILREGSRAKSKITGLNFRRTEFGLCRDLLERVHWTWPWREERAKKAG